MIKIYFTSEKKIKADDTLQRAMFNIVDKNFKLNSATYLKVSSNEIDNDTEISKQVELLANAEKIKVNNYSYKCIVQPVEGHWFEDSPRHDYYLILILTSVEYTCLKIVDETNFIGFHSDDNEIKLVTKNTNSKVFAVIK